MKRFLSVLLLFFPLFVFAAEPTESAVKSWEEYNAATAEREPEKTCKMAASKFSKPGMAIDLGAGGGRDTLYLLKLGWTVLPLDITPVSLAEIEKKAKQSTYKGKLLKPILVSFQKMDLKGESADLINASYTLPFVAKGEFHEVWDKIIHALKPGGRFSGQLFGVDDEWHENPKMNFHTKAEVENLLADTGVIVEHLKEVHSIEPGGGNPKKHWHYFDIIVQKKPSTKR